MMLLLLGFASLVALGFTFLPLGLLGGLVGPLTAGGSSTRGSPLTTGTSLGTVPALTGSTSEASSGGSVPVGARGSDTRLDSSGALLVGTGKLLLLDLLLGLGLGVAVCGTGSASVLRKRVRR